MAIGYYPKMGQVLKCDFSDLQPPEINKIRPVIIISPRLPYRGELVAVVPLSTTPPKHDLPFTVRLSKNYHPEASDDLPNWAKCDLVMNIARSRLVGFKIGRRRWENPKLEDHDLQAVRYAVLCGLGMEDMVIDEKNAKK